MKKALASITAVFFAIAVPAALPGCAKRSPDFESFESGGGSGSIEYSSCENSDTFSSEAYESSINIDKKDITAVRDTFNEEIEALKAAKFDNISYENLKNFSFPDVSEITTYKVVSFEKSPDNLTSEQFFENFVAYLEYLEPGKYSKNEIAEKAGVWYDFKDGPKANIADSYNEIMELSRNDEINIYHMYLLTPDIYFSYMGHGSPFWYQGDAVKELNNGDPELNKNAPHYELVTKDRPIIDYTENIGSDKVYHLVDGDISIADAAKKVNEMLAKMSALCDDGYVEMEACAVKVVDIGNGSYAFQFTVTPVVDGIKYAYADMRGDLMGVGTFSSETDGDECGSNAPAEMIQSDKLSMFVMAHGWRERTPVDVHTSIVPLKDAAESVSKLLSGEMKFKAKSVSLVYDVKGGTDDLVPCWRFVLENSNPEKYYHVYVNAIDGTARVKAIQEVNSGQQFD